MQTSFYSQDFNSIAAILDELGMNPNLAKIVFDFYYKFKLPKIASTPKDLFSKLEEKLDFSLPKIIRTQNAEDGTIKFLVQFHDGKSVECVLIPFFKKYTICLSSQVGCAMNCSFCFTGTQGLKRHLKSEEIIAQYMLAFKYLREHIDPQAKIPNIVFMGQGEPLHNFSELKKALELLTEPKGLHLGPRQITVSSAGYLPGLLQFNELPPVNLAISFHSPINEIRQELIPLNKKYPIEELLTTLKNINLLKRQYITFEYLLIDEVNNRPEDAHLLYEHLKDLPAIINLIPFNPFPGSHYKRPSHEAVENFKEMLVKYRLRTMVRTTKGDDILAACGQLNTKE